MVGPSVPFPARGGFFGVGRSETFQTLSLSLSLFVAYPAVRAFTTQHMCFNFLEIPHEMP